MKPIFEVWMYSLARKLSIRLEQERFDNFMSTMIESSSSIDGNELLRLCSIWDNSNGQTLLTLLNQDDPNQSMFFNNCNIFQFSFQIVVNLCLVYFQHT